MEPRDETPSNSMSALNKKDSPGGGLEKPSKSQDITSLPIPKKTMPKKSIIIVIAVLTLFVLAVIGLVVSGVMHIGFKGKDGEQKTVSSYEVCGQDVIDTWNETFLGFNVSEPPDLDGQIASIKSKNNWDKDPVCVHILLYSALTENNVGQARDLHKKYQELINSPSNDNRWMQIESLLGPRGIDSFLKTVESNDSAPSFNDNNADMPLDDQP
jgi:hypothetical protein